MDKLDPSQLEYPIFFPLKVIGANAEDFESFVLEIIHRHVPGLLEENITSRLSSGDKYRSVSVEFIAQSHEQVAVLCGELSSHKRVLYLL